ncbi:MAG: hypothetical protein EBR82_66290 [Caulobacteraceae bacterium]|nr:hypothetical protein [Caulobacteraceae bacterium]
MKLSKQQQAALASYVRSAVGAIAAVVATGNYAPEDLAKAAVAALLPPLIRWANPKDPSFGRGA